MSLQEGQSVPQASFRAREGTAWKDFTSQELFAGKRVVLFSLPGAYTPTCSSSHLPRYEQLYDRFRAAGIDAIYCVSVNDGFVMEAWGRDQGAEKVQLVPDGNGDFTRGMGFLVDKQDLGFGQRSWRYAAVIEDGVIEKLFVEPDQPGDPFEVSDADTVLAYLTGRTPLEFSLFTKVGCPHCARAKALLDAEGAVYEEIVLTGGVSQRSLETVTGQKTAPQVYHQGERIGTADELEAWFAARKVAASA